jgi:rare lipoprotein A
LLGKYIIIAFTTLSIFSFTTQVEYGKASYYADRFEGRATASGELYHPDSMTAAHRTLPFGSVVKVINVNNNLSAVVRINDRGPFVDGRIIDLSKKAMMLIDGLDEGLVDVNLELILHQK